MIWYDKIRLGMELMRDGCVDNLSHEKCEKECPFKEYCLLFPNNGPRALPIDWEIKNG